MLCRATLVNVNVGGSVYTVFCVYYTHTHTPSFYVCGNEKNTIRDGGNTALKAAYTVDTVDIVDTVDMV